ncbi:Heat shock protein 12A [Hypsizygus marmoreus]|uniref:Heat shock protein 12A n=1 Tax=Hypsizygus marmoreus TaxID=39966 RepID=A0A369JF78_HYPMA|nr:Heat shock protein 12A [Hypsizygus marmoreus]
MPFRSPYNGIHRKLVLAFDIGTTFSGISYSILDPGLVPEIKGVTRFPSQEQVGGDSKIPTIIYYDNTGKVCAAGADAVREGVEDSIEDEGWTKAEWFKLHLRPASSRVTHKLPPLPKKKTVIDVFADFMEYLYTCARTYIQDTHANGGDLWASVQNHIEFVLTHPNGWEGAQQARMRRAAVRAGLVPDTNEGRARVHFVTEGEASLHFCIQNGLTTAAMMKGKGVLIVDAGGGTIDLSAYGQSKSRNKFSFQEVASPQCHFQGSIFVTNHARTFLDVLLKDSKFHEDVGHITKCFDKTTKLRFRNMDEPQYIKFGTARDKDLQLGIRSGQLKLKGADVAKFFGPSIECIVKAVTEQRKCASKPISSIFLVGGFAASDWLFSQLKTSLEPLGLDFCRPDSHVNKAVADGGVSFYIDHFVTARVAKYAYGIGISHHYDETNVEHKKRSSRRYEDASGYELISRGFSIILPKDSQVSETTEFRSPYNYTMKSIESFRNELEIDILCYRGLSEKPEWTDVDTDMYSTLCTVKADVAQFKTTLRPQLGKGSRIYFKLNFEVILSFGLTELTAQLSWKENGEEKRCSAEIVYDYDIIESGFDVEDSAEPDEESETDVDQESAKGFDDEEGSKMETGSEKADKALDKVDQSEKESETVVKKEAENELVKGLGKESMEDLDTASNKDFDKMLEDSEVSNVKGSAKKLDENFDETFKMMVDNEEKDSDIDKDKDCDKAFNEVSIKVSGKAVGDGGDDEFVVI